jgi:hypothetical protein
LLQHRDLYLCLTKLVGEPQSNPTIAKYYDVEFTAHDGLLHAPRGYCRDRRETELGSQPPGHLQDRLVHLGHTTGTEDEFVLTFGQRMQADISALGNTPECWPRRELGLPSADLTVRRVHQGATAVAAN